MFRSTQGNNSFKNLSVLGIGLLFLISKVSFAALTVTLSPGDDIQSAVDSNPDGTIFILTPGVYRNQTVNPKEGNKFIGESIGEGHSKCGAVMNGARVLTSFIKEGTYWVAHDQTQQGWARGFCALMEDGTRYDGCIYPEDLFIDDEPLRQVTSLEQVEPGKWFFDYDANKIYMADDPNGRLVETSITTHAFRNTANNVTIEGLIIEKYANPAQFGAIHGDHTSGWIIKSNEIRLNHGVGIRMGRAWTIENNRVYRNGQIGITGQGDNAKIIGNEISHNNSDWWFAWGWEAGGTKFFHSDGLLIKGNYSHNNGGPGLWTDADNINIVYEDNVVVDNGAIGIFHEISYDAVIRNNVAKGNGKAADRWLYGAQIMSATSMNVKIYGNYVEVDADGGNGITVIQQNRGSGIYGLRLGRNNYIHHNVVVYHGNRGLTGMATDWQPDDFWANGNNLFDYNVYCAPRLDRARWEYQRMMHWEDFRAAGQEPNGVAYTNIQECENTTNL